MLFMFLINVKRIFINRQLELQNQKCLGIYVRCLGCLGGEDGSGRGWFQLGFGGKVENGSDCDGLLFQLGGNNCSNWGEKLIRLVKSLNILYDYNLIEVDIVF